jgi:nucleotide-binding universal stress UspA family protein
MNHKPKRTGVRGRMNRRGPAMPKRAPTVLVALDGSPQALAALPVARSMAEIERATVHIVHIAEGTLSVPELLGKLGLTVEDTRGTVIDQASGEPAERIVQLARRRQSACIILCTHTGAGRPAGELGRVARQVLLTAPCPVVLVPPVRGLRPLVLRHVLLPCDGTPTTAAAVGPALALASRAGAEVTALHVAAVGEARAAEPGSVTAPRYVDQPQHEWPAWCQEFLHRVCCLSESGQVARLRLALVAGEPGAEIVRFARAHDIDLIVLAWRGTLEPERAAAARAVIGAAPCPILILRVREKEEPAPPPDRREGFTDERE